MPRQSQVVSAPPPDVAARMRDARPEADQDKLERVRGEARNLRDLTLLQLEQTALLAETGRKINTLKSETLPGILGELGIRSIGLEAEGNMPAVDFSLAPYYKASIAADWPQPQQDAAFKWMDDNGHGDLIKRTITIELGRNDDKLFKRVMDALARVPAVEPTVKQGVSWNTLTAFVKEQIEKYKKSPPLELLGATVGQIVTMKPRKEK